MSTSHISSQSRRSSQMRSLSPIPSTSKEESHRKTAKSERHTDCKTENESQTQSQRDANSDTEHDCPAFRLRPRRSTPKPNPSPGKRFSHFTAMMNRLKYLKDGSDVKRKLMFNKQKVYPSTFNSEELFINTRIIPPRSPSCSITEDIFVSPFAQKISPLELEADKEYGANYLSLKIIFKEDIEVNDERMLKLIATDVNIDDDGEASTSTGNNEVKRKIAIYLYGSYINCRAEKNKVINIVKFITQSKLEEFDETIDGDFDFAIVVKSCDNSWVPFVSITTKWKAPEDPRELNRTLFLTPPDEKPKLEVSSDSLKK